MWTLPEVSILGFPLESFLLLMVAFLGLGLFFTRGRVEPASPPGVPRSVVPRPASPKPEPSPRPVAEEHKMAA